MSIFSRKTREKFIKVISALRPNFPTRLLCKMLGVSKSSYYDYVSGRPYVYSQSKLDLLTEIREIFNAHKKRYGSRRIQAVLVDRGHKVGFRPIGTIMQREGLKDLQSKRFVPKTTQSPPPLKRHPNLSIRGGKST